MFIKYQNGYIHMVDRDFRNLNITAEMMYFVTWHNSYRETQRERVPHVQQLTYEKYMKILQKLSNIKLHVIVHLLNWRKDTFVLSNIF